MIKCSRLALAHLLPDTTPTALALADGAEVDDLAGC